MPRSLKYLLLIFLFGTGQCDKIDPGDILFIPDPNFLDALIRKGMDKNGDGKLNRQEAEQVTTLFLGPSGINDLKGIEAIINLDTLVLEVNPLFPPDLSANRSLLYLAMPGCGLAELDISQNAELKHLDISGNLGLDSFLKTINRSGNPVLESLILYGNELNGIDLSHNPLLKKLNCSRNRIRDLELGINLMLEELHCKNNMPFIHEVSVWTTPFPPEGVRVLMEYSPRVFFTTQCSN